jgi:hypothetical protein
LEPVTTRPRHSRTRSRAEFYAASNRGRNAWINVALEK